MNRIGDAGFLIGFGILFYQLGGKLLLPGTGDGEATNMFLAIRGLLEDQGYSMTNPPLWLTAAGIGLFQGYWFARPAFEALPALSPEAVRAAA